MTAAHPSDKLASSAFQVVTHLAGQTPVHRAFQWFHLQEPKLRDWHRRIASIPAPPFGEAARAHWLAEQFTVVGLTDVHIDPCGNTLGWMRGAAATGLCTLVSAHLDTVFPAGTSAPVVLPSMPTPRSKAVNPPNPSESA